MNLSSFYKTLYSLHSPTAFIRIECSAEFTSLTKFGAHLHVKQNVNIKRSREKQRWTYARIVARLQLASLTLCTGGKFEAGNSWVTVDIIQFMYKVTAFSRSGIQCDFVIVRHCLLWDGSLRMLYENENAANVNVMNTSNIAYMPRCVRWIL